MAAHKKNPFVEVLGYIRTAPDDELKHIAAAATVELKARQPQGEAPRPRKSRKPSEPVVAQEK